MWRSDRAALGLAALAVSLACAATPAAALRLCLPPLFDGGQRLFSPPAPHVFWLAPLLRQHELCWRTPERPDERRILLVGNSAVYGYPLEVDDTLGALLNRRFAADGVNAHVFNLGWVNTYQVRDAVIIHEALPYAVDAILYPVTLSDFHHVAPLQFAPVIEFFRSNRTVVEDMAAHDPPAGLEAPFERYQRSLAAPRERRPRWYRLREIGTLIRVGVREHAQRVADDLAGVPPAAPPQPNPGRWNYDCAKTERVTAKDFVDFHTWNVLAYLEELQRTRGIRILVVNWPTAHVPAGSCYNQRYTARAMDAFNTWIVAETRARGLRFLDLHTLLPRDDFVDTVHVGAAGHRRIADAIAPVLEEMVRSAPPA